MGGHVTAVSVWVEAGREGLLLSYSNGSGMVLEVGDLVRVKLRGKLHNGLVNETNAAIPEGISLEPVLERLEPAAINEKWQKLLIAVANQCHTAPFQVLKTALPNGWLGKKQQAAGLGRKQLVARAIPKHEHSFINLANSTSKTSTSKASNAVTAKQQLLLELLRQQGPKPVNELVLNGYSRSLLKLLEAKALIELSNQTKPPQGWPSSPARNLEIPPNLNPDQANVLQLFQNQREQ